MKFMTVNPYSTINFYTLIPIFFINIFSFKCIDHIQEKKKVLSVYLIFFLKISFTQKSLLAKLRSPQILDFCPENSQETKWWYPLFVTCLFVRGIFQFEGDIAFVLFRFKERNYGKKSLQGLVLIIFFSLEACYNL